MTTRLIEGPEVEPLTTDDVLTYLGILDPMQATYAATLIAPVREWAENRLHRALSTQTWEKTLDRFPGTNDAIELLMPPVQSIEYVEYVNADGETARVLADDLLLDNAAEPAWIMPAYGKQWPTTRPIANAVRVRYVCGYDGPDNLPRAIKHWLLAHVASLDAERAAHTDARVQPIDFLDRLVDRYLVAGFA